MKAPPEATPRTPNRTLDMKLRHASVALLAGASLLISSCVYYGPGDGYGTFTYSTNGYSSSVAWTSASYDANGFPIFGYSYGRPVYGYTEAGVAVFTIAALTALCFVPHWKPAPWYHGHWHYPAHIHRCAAPPHFPAGHRPGHRPPGGLNAPIHRNPGAVFRPHKPAPRPSVGHQPNRPGNKPGMGMQPNRPGNRPGVGVQPNRPGHKPGVGMQPNRPGNRPGAGVQPNRPGNRPGAGVHANRPGNRPGVGVQTNRPGNRPGAGVQPNRPSNRPTMTARPANHARPAGAARPNMGSRPTGAVRPPMGPRGGKR